MWGPSELEEKRRDTKLQDLDALVKHRMLAEFMGYV
jgi:hypothetical protein